MNQVNILDKFRKNQKKILNCTTQNHLFVNEKTNSYICLLTQMQVTKLSKFEDMTWDYNDDVLNPPKSVSKVKLIMNFNKYNLIPPYIIIEIKCVLSYLTFSAAVFSTKDKVKPNTAIALFESGLRFLNHVFEKLVVNTPIEFIHDKYRTLSDILESDFKDAAKDYQYRVDKAFTSFCSYLKHPFTKKILDHNIQVDFDSLEFPEQKKKSREASLVFENDHFEKLVSHSTYRIIEFLQSCGEEISDLLALKYQNFLGASLESFDWTRELVDDYAVIRLFRKGYPEEEISKIVFINPEFYIIGTQQLTEGRLRKKIKELHGFDSFESIRRKINEVYDACCYIVAQYTGMRPNALSGILIDSCLDSSDGDDLIVSEEHKGKSENFGLFDDKFVAIPIVKDAIKAAKIISKCKNNPYLFSNADTVAFRTLPQSMSGGIRSAFEKYFVNLFGQKQFNRIKFTTYMYRHTLAYQLYRADLGLPFISYQLKHMIERISKYSGNKATSDVTLGYGELADRLSSDATKGKWQSIRKKSEVESVKSTMDPDAIYLGEKGKEHKKRLEEAFIGYRAAGYSDDQVYEAMTEQGIAIINVGSGFCFGDSLTEEFDNSLPCLGGLRCNPVRCKNAIVTKAHAPKWREVYLSNKALIGKEGFEDKQDQVVAAMKEAEAVLNELGEALILL